MVLLVPVASMHLKGPRMPRTQRPIIPLLQFPVPVRTHCIDFLLQPIELPHPLHQLLKLQLFLLNSLLSFRNLLLVAPLTFLKTFILFLNNIHLRHFDFELRLLALSNQIHLPVVVIDHVLLPIHVAVIPDNFIELL